MMLMAILLLQVATATSPAADQGNREVTVTGRRIADSADALAACAAQHCPPERDIALSMTYSSNRMLAGDYEGARETLLSAERRNGRYAAQYPVQVAGLISMEARLTTLIGMPAEARLSEIEALDALEKGLPKDDPRVLAQRVAVGDALAREGRYEAASDAYTETARRARHAGAAQVEGQALLSDVALWAALGQVRWEYRPRAEEAEQRLTRTRDAALKPFREAAAKTLDALAHPGRTPDSPPVAADAATRDPVLLYASDISTNALQEVSTIGRSGDGRRPQWADVGFHVEPDGSVLHIAVLRHSDSYDDGWIGIATRALGGRRYTAYPADAHPPGVDRIERYLVVFDRVAVTPSRLKDQAAIGNIDTLDLTPPDRAAAKSGG